MTLETLKGYTNLNLIGKGGFGEVYSAVQPFVNREVAIKIILPQFASQADFVRRFETEAQLVANLEHPHIVPLYDYWRDPEGAYLVMRYLRGGNLEQMLARARLPLDKIQHLFEQTCAALMAAHRGNVVHQDIKPANILLDTEGNAYLSDFGIAKQIDKNAVAREDNEQRQASLHYASPELLSYSPVNFRSDIYSMGILLYEMLTGELPFKGENPDELMFKHMYEDVPPLIATRPDLPETLNKIVQTATAKNPRTRYSDPNELAAEVRAAISGFLQPRQAALLAAATNHTAITEPVKKREFSLADLPLPPSNPYKGLRPFKEADAKDFFGRDTLLERLLKRMQEPNGALLGVVGASGSGKSSVVRAGLIPRLKQGALQGSDKWFYSEMTPGAAPLQELEQALLRVAKNRANVKDLLTDPQGFGLFQALNLVLPDADAQMVLVIDQFEEAFTLAKPHEAAQFLSLLTHTLRQPLNRLWIIITLRADFVDKPLQDARFGALFSDRIEFVLPFAPNELEQVIVKPAERAKLAIEPALVATIVGDVSKQPGALPLLQYTLTELFNNSKGGPLTAEAYRKLGGISGALTSRADELMQAMQAADKDLVRLLFLRLITLNEGAEPTRRRMLQPDLTPDDGTRERMTTIINQFAKYRLLTFDREPLTRTPTVEIAHEALIREWAQAKTWINDNRAQLEMQRRLAASASEWLKQNKESSILAVEARLANFEALTAQGTFPLSADERAYLHASIEQRQQTLRRNRRANTILRAVAIVAGVAAVVALVFFGIASNAAERANNESVRANAQADISLSRQLAAVALSDIEQTDKSLLLSLAALEIANTFEAHDSLLRTLQTYPQLTRILPTADGTRAIAISPDGTRMIVGGLDTQLQLWDLAHPLEAVAPNGTPWAGHQARITSAAYSPDGTLITVADGAGVVRLWEAQSGSVHSTFNDGAGNIMWSVAFSPNGRWLAAGNADGRLWLWDVADGRAIQQITNTDDGGVYSVAFSPDGALLAGGMASGDVLLWSVAADGGLTELYTLRGHVGPVNTLAFNAAGRILASGGADNTVRRWLVANGAPTGEPLTGHSNGVRALAFAPRSTTLASGDNDGTLLLWDIAFGGQIGRINNPYGQAVQALAFTPDGQTLVVAGDSRLSLWNLQQTQPFARAYGTSETETTVPYLSVAAQPQGTLLATVSGINNQQDAVSALWLWDRTSGQRAAVLLARQSELLTDAAFSADGQLLAVVGLDQQIRLWDMRDQTVIGTRDAGQALLRVAVSGNAGAARLAVADANQTVQLWARRDGALENVGDLRGHADKINALAYSTDGSTLVSGAADGTILVWDTATRSIRSTLLGHESGVMALALSADGLVLASGARDQTVRFWDLRDGTAIGAPRTGHQGWVLSLAFSEDGALLASGGEDGAIILWDTATQNALALPFVAHSDWVNGLAFRDSMLYSASNDLRLLAWAMNVPAWRARACGIAARPLNDDEQRQYHLTAAQAAPCAAG
jgi:WD40 repeat protein/serine/threonine protein kinase